MFCRAEFMRIVIVPCGIVFRAYRLCRPTVVSSSFVSIIVCRRLIVAANADVGCQLLILFLCQSVEPGKVFLLSVDTACCPVFIDAAHLPGLQSQSQQLRTVGGVRVESETGVLSHRLGIVHVAFPLFCRHGYGVSCCRVYAIAAHIEHQGDACQGQ